MGNFLLAMDRDFNSFLIRVIYSFQMSHILQSFSNWIHGTPQTRQTRNEDAPVPSETPPTAPGRAKLPAHPQGEQTAEIYSKSSNSLEVLYNKTTFSGGSHPGEMTLTSPAIGEQPLKLSSQDGQLHAKMGDQELNVKHMR